MERKILSYSISLALCLLMFLPYGRRTGIPTRPPPGSTSQEGEEGRERRSALSVIQRHVRRLGLVGNRKFRIWRRFPEFRSGVDVNLKNRFFPIAELGYGSTDTWSDKGIHYKSNAPYFRIGMDYNTLYKKQHGHMLLVGLRYGVSSFKYDVDALGLDDPIYGGIVGNPNLDDEIWGGSLPYNHKG